MTGEEWRKREEARKLWLQKNGHPVEAQSGPMSSSTFSPKAQHGGAPVGFGAEPGAFNPGVARFPILGIPTLDRQDPIGFFSGHSPVLGLGYQHPCTHGFSVQDMTQGMPWTGANYTPSVPPRQRNTTLLFSHNFTRNSSSLPPPPPYQASVISGGSYTNVRGNIYNSGTNTSFKVSGDGNDINFSGDTSETLEGAYSHW